MSFDTINKHMGRDDYTQIRRAMKSFSDIESLNRLKKVFEEHPLIDVDASDQFGINGLWRAVYDGKIECTKFLLSCGADPNHIYSSRVFEKNTNIDKNIFSLVIRGPKEGNPRKLVDLARLLIDAGVDLQQDSYRFTVAETMFVCMKNGYSELLNFILEKGIEIDAVKEYFGLPLLCYCTDEKTAHVLLKHNQKIDEKTYDGKTPLFYANKKSVVDFFIRNGANVNAKDNLGRRVIDVAIEEENIPLCIGIIKNKKFELLDEKGRTPLHLAILKGDINLISNLILLGLKPDIQDKSGKTPIQLSKDMKIAFGGIDILDAALLELKNEVKEKDKYGRTPLFYVDTPILTEAVLNLGADLNVKDKYGRTPAQYARFKGRHDVYDVLKEKNKIKQPSKGRDLQKI